MAIVACADRVPRIAWAAVATAILAPSGTAVLGQVTPPDSEFQVNSLTAGEQELPSIVRLPGDEFIVTWTSDVSSGSDDSFASVQARRFEADGTPLAPEFQVNNLTQSPQSLPHAAVGPGGEFVIVWQSSDPATGDNQYVGVQARRFAADGSPMGDEFRVNTYTPGRQLHPIVAIGDDGSATVVWDSAGSGGSDQSETSVQLQRYAPDGSPDGGETQVNTFEFSWQYFPDIGLAADGTAAVVWASVGSFGSDQDESSVQLRRYAPDGTSLGTEVQVNQLTTGFQWVPQVEVADDGSFLVVWQSDVSSGTDTSGRSIQARFYDSDGSPLGGEFQVNTYVSGHQIDPSVSRAASGGFVVAWGSEGSNGSDDSYGSIQAQRFSSTGVPLGGQFQVNQVTILGQIFPDVAMASDGEFTIVWESQISDATGTDEESVRARISPMVTIFSDGFESGDTSAWSRSVP